MDLAWNSLHSLICLAGPHGVSWDLFKVELGCVMNLKAEQVEWPPRPALKYLLDVYNNQDDFKIGKFASGDHFKKDQRTKLLFFVDLQPVQISDYSAIDPTDLRFYCANSKTRHSHLFQGRPIQLSDSSIQTLEVIASYGQNGVTQAELAKILGCDSKNAFHWLKSLIANDLIARTPVASKKAFTYLLTLTKYLDEEITVTSRTVEESSSHTLLVSSKEIRQMIVDILAKAPGQTMVSKDVFDQTGLDRFLIKHFRRAATKLNEIGWLEYLFEDQLVGPCCRLFRLKRNPAEGLDLNSFLATQEKLKLIKDPQDQIKSPRGHDYHPDHPIIHQLILLLARAYPEPLTTNQLSHHFNISRKYIYKLIDRIFPVNPKRPGVIGAEGIEKVSDFVGREKRLRLFIKSEEWRDYYINLFTPLDQIVHFTSETSSNYTSQIPSHTISNIASFSSSRPSTPSNSNLQSPSDTRTRQLRHQALLTELSTRKILEIGKELCHRLQGLLGDTRFTLDVKTLRRSVEILEREGQLKVIVATVPNGTRTLLISSELSVSDEIVQNYISQLNEQARTGPLSATTQKLNRLKESMQTPDYFVEGSLPLGVPQNPSINIRALTQFGFVHGIMARAQLLHQFLLQKQVDFAFQTIPTIFDQIPLGLYMKLIGVVRMSRGLFESLPELESTELQSLPEIYREELSLNRKRFQSQISILLGTLEQLKLIEGEEQFSSLNFRLPLKYNLAKDVPLYDFRGRVQKFIKFTGTANFKDSFNEFWTGMNEICTDFHSRHTSIHESVEDETASGTELPKPILLARYPDSWKQRPSRERDLERSVKKLAIDSFTISKSKRRRTDSNFSLETIESLATEFEVSIERVNQMYDNFLRIFEEREEAKRLDKLATRQCESDSDSSDSEDLDHLRWTTTDWTRLSLAFCILQQSPFYSASTGIKWNLATKIFDKPKSPIIVRRHGLKLFKNYNELRKMIELDTIVSLVMRKISYNSEDCLDLSNLFKTVYDSCQQIIDSINSDSDSDDIFDAFNVSLEDEFVTLSSRQGHFLDTIDTWVQTRSFRHGLLINHSGLQLERKEGEIDTLISGNIDDNCTILKQILVTATTEHFDYEATIELIKSIEPAVLQSSLNHLIETGFATKNRTKDKIRLFSFPLAVSESVREVIECVRDTLTGETVTVDCNTETLSIPRIEYLINSSILGEAEIKTLKPQNQNKFDCPVEIKLNPKAQESSFDLTEVRNYKSTIWFTATHPQIFLSSIAIACLNHLEFSIKSQPGISKTILKNRYRNIFGYSTSFDVLIETLIKSNRIQLIETEYLQ